MADKAKTRAGTEALPFPWEDALQTQLGRTKKRLIGLATDPKQELLEITRQYLPSPTDSPEEKERKLDELALGMTGTPIKGVRPYGVAQEGAFYRVSPEAARRNAARSRGNLESGGEGSEVTGGAPRGDVPESFAGQAFQDLTASQNFPLEVADKYTRQFRGGQYSLPAMSESSLAKQSAIGRTFQLAATDNPQYKKAVFAAYKKKYPKIVEQAKAKDYDDLLEKSYVQLAKETEQQFKELPINMSYHRAGEGNYRSSGEMLHDVHKNRHLYVFQGGDPHDFLNKIDPDTGLNTNEMFRAVHDFFGHAVHGAQFGPKGEELAWLAHSRMYSPLARLAMTSETRGQNSFVNYTPINAELKRAISQIEEELYEAKRRGRDSDIQRLEQLKAGLFNEFQFAPQKSVLLPPEFTTKEFEGGMPSYIQPLIEPKAGTTTQTPLTHFSTSPDIMMTDPQKYGTGIAGEEAARLEGVQGAVRPRTYFYAGEPEVVTPEPGLGPYRYRTEGESLYNISEDPLSLKTLATEANRIPFTARANAGLIRQAQAMADLERMIKEYGYEGYMQPGGQTPAAAVFTPKLVQRKADGGLAMATGGQAFPLQDDFEAEMERRRSRPRTRAGVPVEDTNVLGGALSALGETLLGAGRGAVATTLGAPADILNLLNVKSMGTPDISYGSEYFKDILPFAPTTQTGKTAQQLGEFLPINPEEPLKAGVAGVKKLAPTARELVEAGLEKAVAPTRMYAVPPTEVKPGKVKAPANEIGFYNPAEKAALNLQRKKGTGDSFISDLKKQPGVNDERITELGLDQFRGKPNVTREEIIAAAEQNRIPLQESVKRERNEAAIEALEQRHDELLDLHSEASVTGDARAREQYAREMAENIAQQKALKNVEEAKFSPSDYPDYSMPGGTDYREIRVKMPAAQKPQYFIAYKDGSTMGSGFASKAEAEQELLDTFGQRPDLEIRQGLGDRSTTAKTEDNFLHSTHHGDEPNVLFHLRVANHADADGKKGLLIDELQSDWHQQGAKKGYKGEDAAKAEKEFKEYSQQLADKYDLNPQQNLSMYATMKKMSPDEVSKYEQLQSAWVSSKEGVPDAPFKDNWYQLGLKRAIKEAADTGMDRVYLTTGARQADRYDLSKQLSRVSYQDGVLHGYDNSGALVVNKAMTPEELPNYVGKDLGKKMVENAAKDAEIRNKISVAKYEGAPESEIDALRSQLDGVKTDYAGVDLKVGGEGMKQWYDKTYKNYLEKYAKQHGSKLGMTRLKTAKDGDDLFEVVLSNGKVIASRPNRKQAEATAASFDGAEIREIDHSEPVYYIDITDAMRETAKKGQSYAEGGAVHPAVEKFAASLPHPAVTQFVQRLADGGGVWNTMVQGRFNTIPDVSDSEGIIQGPAV